MNVLYKIQKQNGIKMTGIFEGSFAGAHLLNKIKKVLHISARKPVIKFYVAIMKTYEEHGLVNCKLI